MLEDIPINNHPLFSQVFKWFMKMTPIFAELAADQAAKNGTDDNYNLSDFPLVVISAINAIGVCYYVRISARVEYLDLIAPYFRLVRRFVSFFEVK